MPALTALPLGSALDPSLWAHLREEIPWAARECIDAVAARDAGNAQLDCAVIDLGKWGGHGPLLAFWPLTADYQLDEVSVYGKIDGAWARVGGVSRDWLVTTGHLPDRFIRQDIDANEASPAEAAKPVTDTP